MTDKRVKDLPTVASFSAAPSGQSGPLDLLLIEALQSGTDGTTPANNTYASSAVYLRDFLKIATGSQENRFVNGDMEIDQANEGASVTSGAGLTHGVDYWRVVDSTGGLFSFQRSTDAPVGFKNSTILTSLSSHVTGASDQFYFSQAIEGSEITDLNFGTANAKSLVLTFWAKASATGSYGFSISNGANNRYWPNHFTISNANTWQYFVFIIPGDTAGTWATTTSGGLTIYFDLGSGTTQQTATPAVWGATKYYAITGDVNLSATNTATLQIANARLRAGTFDVGYVRRPFPAEMAACQRRYAKTFAAGTAPAQNAGVAGAITVRNTIATDDPAEWWQFPVPMRASPTIVTYNPSVANANWRNITGGADVAVAVDGPATKSSGGVIIATSATVANIGDYLGIHATADARI